MRLMSDVAHVSDTADMSHALVGKVVPILIDTPTVRVRVRMKVKVRVRMPVTLGHYCKELKIRLKSGSGLG